MTLIKRFFPRHKIALTIGRDNAYMSIDDGEPQWMYMHCVTYKGRLAAVNTRYCCCDGCNPHHIKQDVRFVGEEGALEPEVLRQMIRHFVGKSLPMSWQRRRATVLIAVKPEWSQEQQTVLKEIVKSALR